MRGGRGGGIAARRQRWYESPAPAKVDSVEQVYYPPRTYFTPGLTVGEVPSIVTPSVNRCPPSAVSTSDSAKEHWTLPVNSITLCRDVRVKPSHTSTTLLPAELKASGPIKKVKRKRTVKPLRRERGTAGLLQTVTAGQRVASKSTGGEGTTPTTTKTPTTTRKTPTTPGAPVAAAQRSGASKFLDDEAQVRKRDRDDEDVSDGQEDMDDMSAPSSFADDESMSGLSEGDDDILM